MADTFFRHRYRRQRRLECMRIERGHFPFLRLALGARRIGQVVLFLTSVVTHAAALEITANQDVGVRELDLTTARLIFGMRLLKWPDGTPVRVFVLEGDSDIHQRFAKEKLQVFAYQLQQAWDRLVFSGTGQAPNQVATVEEMRKRVTMTPGAIGYLPDDYLRDDVSIIEIKAQ